MRHLTDAELLSFSKLLEMESNSLTVAKASLLAISDPQLKNLAQSGITTSEARIMGLQQFIVENNLVTTGQSQADNQQKEVY